MNFTVAMVAMFLMWPFSSGKSYQMTAGQDVPAANGVVKVSKDKANGDVKLDIKVDNLARPSSLTPSANDYLVWIRTNSGDAHREGAIGVDKHLKGELTVETVSKDFEVLITAEQSETPSMPSNDVVLRTHVDVR